MENPQQALVELTAAVSGLADLIQILLKEQRRGINKLGADIDEVPSIVRLELEKQTAHVKELLERLIDPRPTLQHVHNILSKARYDLWMEAQSEEAESDAHRAVRRGIDHLRGAVRVEQGLEPDSLVEPDVRVGLVKARKTRDDEETGVHLVLAGKPVVKVPVKKLGKILKWSAPFVAAAAMHLLHMLHVIGP